jgi:serine phosphatase RsbU (regulator of sigma subunit)
MPIHRDWLFSFAGSSMKNKTLIRLLFFLTSTAWLGLLLSELTVVFSLHTGIEPDVPRWLPGVLLSLFLLGVYLYYKFRLERSETLSFVDLLWRVFATGLIAIAITLVLQLIEFLPGTERLTTHFLYLETTYLIVMPLWGALVVICFIAWKRLILYQKTKWTYRLWVTFEYALAALLLVSILPVPQTAMFSRVILAIFSLMALVISANTKWVAYLNFRQKLTSLLLLLLSLFYVVFLFYISSSVADDLFQLGEHIVDHRDHLFLLAAFIFITIYAGFSFLVILFNLPTTSAFEQKLEEVMNFQRISQSIQTEKNEESVYRILLETSVSTVDADAAWLEVKTSNPGTTIYTHGIDEKEVRKIMKRLADQQVAGFFDQVQDKTRNLSKYLRGFRFRSLVAFPVFVKDEQVGTLALLKELEDGFSRDMQRILAAFANQAGLSIENFRLMEEVLESERYKEEMKIAKRVQRSLLPLQLEQDVFFQTAAFSESADEVGGDYYDSLRLSGDKVAMIIADVSGKGTTAAFHMSQMKGIFYSLALPEVRPDEFMIRANRALSYCLERGSFISAAYLVINTRSREVHYARAGHCPVLLYRSAQQAAEYLKDYGTALGMLRSSDYASLTECRSIQVEPGDIMVLYTDGITEARNRQGEEFGYDRLSALISRYHADSPEQLIRHVIEELYAFTETENINDDYTILIVKFRETDKMQHQDVNSNDSSTFK